MKSGTAIFTVKMGQTTRNVVSNLTLEFIKKYKLQLL